MSRRQRTYLLTGSVCAVLAGVGLVATFAAGSGTDQSPTVPAPAVGSATPQLSEAAKQAFGVFARPVGDSEEVSLVENALKGYEHIAIGDRLNLDPSSVRLAQATGGIEALVAGDSESICLVMRLPGKALTSGRAPASTAIAPATPMIEATGYPPGEPSQEGGELAVSALLPNNSTNVTVTDAAGSVKSIPIVNNTVAFIAGEEDVVRWVGPEGHRYSSGLPH